MPADDEFEIENPSDYRLSTLADRKYTLYLRCPACGRESITEGAYYYRKHGDMTFATFLQRLVCQPGPGCGKLGVTGRVKLRTRRTYTSSVDYLPDKDS